MERAGRTLDRVDRMFGVARESVTNPAYQALEREWQPKLSEAADAILFNQGLFKRISAVYESLADSNLQPDQVRVVTRIYEQFVRGGAHLNAADKQRLSDINQQLAARFAEFRAKVLADENTSTVVRRRRGDRQHAVERRSLSDTLPAARSPRDRLEEIQEPRRQRGRKRHDGDDYGYRTAARRARQAARISEPRALANDGYDGGRSGNGAAFPVEDLAVRCRAGQGRGRRDAGDRRSRRSAGHHRALGFPVLRRESAQGEIRPRRRRNQAVLRARQPGGGSVVVCRAPVRHCVPGDYRQCAGVSPRRARVERRRYGHRPASRRSVSG